MSQQWWIIELVKSEWYCQATSFSCVEVHTTSLNMDCLVLRPDTKLHTNYIPILGMPRSKFWFMFLWKLEPFLNTPGKQSQFSLCLLPHSDSSILPSPLSPLLSSHLSSTLSPFLPPSPLNDLLSACRSSSLTSSAQQQRSRSKSCRSCVYLEKLSLTSWEIADKITQNVIAEVALNVAVQGDPAPQFLYSVDISFGCSSSLLRQ